MLVEPGDGLVEGLLLGVLLHLAAQVATDSKAVLNTRVEVNLVRLASLLQNLLGLVALLGREDAIGLGGGDGEGSGDGGELLLVNEARMGNEANLDAVLVVADNVLSAQKVSANL